MAGSALLVLALVLLPRHVAAQATSCAPASLEAVGEAAAMVDDGDPQAARERLQEALAADGTCRALTVAEWATRAAQDAAQAATRGGPPELLEPVNAAVTALEALAAEDGRTSAAEYARAALLAARAAAQDERDEMRVWLTHARGVAARLTALGDAPRWPQTIDMLEGALWFEVDRFAEASEAYERAAASGETVAAWLGLARTRSRLGRREGACAAWKAAASLGKARRPQGVGTIEAFLALADCYR